MAGVHEEIGMTVADAGVAHGQALEPQLLDHAARGGARRVFENAAGAFLAERLAGAPFFVADTNTFEDYFERFGGEFQYHRENHILRRKRSVPVFERNLVATENFDRPTGSPVELHFADIAADLHPVGPGIHAQSASDGAGNTDESFHAAEVVLGAEGDHAAQVCRGVDVRKIAIEHDIGLRTDELQDHPGQLPVTHQQIRAAAEELMRDVVRVEQIQEIRKAFVALDAGQVLRTTEAQRGKAGKHGALPQLDMDLCEFGNDPGITNAHDASDAPFQAKP